MRLVSTLLCRPGMRLGKPIITEKGITLLAYRVELTQWIIEKLYRMGYDYIYIDDPYTEDIVIQDPLREETKVYAREQLRHTYAFFRDQPTSERMASLTGTYQKIASRIIEDLDDRNDEMIMMMNLGNKSSDPEEIFIQNALNVCLYTTKLGLIERLPRDELMGLSIGSLLHDLGNARLPEELLRKNTPLTPQEYTGIQKHTELGYHLLKDAAGIPLSAAHCALQHHEKMDGSGYPLKLKEAQIHPFAKWVGLIDAYDSMTNPRSYRKAMLPHQALEVLYACAGTIYDKALVELFRNKVALFPVGLSVRLSTGEIGIVSKVTPSFKQRPTIRVLKNPFGEELRQPYEIDLSQNLNIMIHGVSEETFEGECG
jgi:HD-GYP domain-containing protein (c-di-GMP phosphodiesterase class II)